MKTDTAPDAEVERALRRAGVYRLLGRAFGYPSGESLDELARLAGTASGAPNTPGEIAQGLRRLADAARAADPSTLAGEHVFLFDRQVRCPPYEGAYGPVPPWAAGKSATLADIAGFYGAFQLKPAEARPDTEDHVAAELEFMSALAVKEAYALAEGNEEGLAVTRGAEAAFLTDHLGRWAGVFAETLRAATPVPFYASAADLLATWIQREVETLGASPVLVVARSGPDPLQEDTLRCPMAEPRADPAAAG